MTFDYFKQSLELHQRHRGKLEVRSKVPLRTRRDLSLAYTPGVAEPCRAIAEDPKAAYRYTMKGNCVAVVSDGSAVLGLGNIGGLAGLPVMEGKCLLFKRFAGIDAFPVCLATQDVDEIVETVIRIAPSFGGINLEDIAAPACFEVERKLKQALDIPVFHDDQHGTAIVTLAGLLNALKVAGKRLDEARIVISGSGAAGISITELLLLEGARDVVLCDRHGIVVKGRDHLNPFKAKIARKTNPRKLSGHLKDALVDADVFIGVSAPGLLTTSMVQSMAPKSIVFAMANPIPEIMPDEAKKAGAFIVATGRSDFPNQINNVLAFPGVFRGALDCGASAITQDMLLAAAHALERLVNKPTPSNIIPSIFDRMVAKNVAKAICRMAR